MLHRGHEGTDGGDGELTVPMAWLYAEYIADELLRTGDLMPPTSFEFRAGRDALALTIFLSDTDGELSGIRVVTQLETWLSLTAYDQPWHEWVRDRPAGAGPRSGGGGVALAPGDGAARARSERGAGRCSGGGRGRGAEGLDARLAARTAAGTPRDPSFLDFCAPGPIRGPERSESFGCDCVTGLSDSAAWSVPVGARSNPTRTQRHEDSA